MSYWGYDDDTDAWTAASLRTRKTGEQNMLPQLPGQMPEWFNRGVRNIAGPVIGGMLGQPQKAIEQAQEYTNTGQYDAGPVFDAATTAMTGGIPFKIPGTSLASGLVRRDKPPAPAAYHATASPDEYAKFKLPPPEHDIGIHTSINPNVSSSYLFKDVEPGTVDFMSGKVFGAPDAAEPRIKPVLMDVQNALKYPADAIKWNNPDYVISHLEEEMRKGFTAPRGLLSDFHNIGGTSWGWQKDFVPMLKDRGYDSIWYPHFDPGTGTNKYNSFMAFDPEQVVHRYSPEGEKLAKDRGVYEAIRKGSRFNDDEGKFGRLEPWKLPEGILKNPEEIESFVRSRKKNTAKWWEDDSTTMHMVDKQYQQKQADIKAKKAVQDKNWDEQGKLVDLYHSGDMPISKFNEEYDKIWGIGKHIELPTNAVNNIPYMLQKNKPPTSTDAAVAHFGWKQSEAIEQLKSGKITQKEYDKIWKEAEDKKDQYYGEMLAAKSKEQLKSAPKGIMGMQEFEKMDAYELGLSLSAGEITASQHKDLLKKLYNKDKPPSPPINSKFGWIDALFTPPVEVKNDPKNLAKEIKKFIKNKNL